MAASYFLPKLVLNCFKFQKWTDSGWPQLTILTIVSCLWDSGHILEPSVTTWHISVFFIVHILNNGCKITGNPTDIKQWTVDGVSEKIKIIEVKQSVFFTYFFFFSFWSLIAMSIFKKNPIFKWPSKDFYPVGVISILLGWVPIKLPPCWEAVSWLSPQRFLFPC